MIKNYLLITFRSMMKNKLFIFINILGMAISIASCIVAYFNYDFNRGFDENHANAPTIYRVNSIREFQNEKTKFGHVPMALGNSISQNVKDVDRVVRYSPDGGNFRIKEELFNSDLTYVDPDFFNVFTYEFVEGSGSLDDKSKIFISDELAEKYFGSEKALGKVITQVLDSGKVKEYEIGGVFKRQPSNSSFYSQALTNFHNQFKGDPEYTENSWRYRITLFLQVNNPSRVSAITEQLKPYVENNNQIREDFKISEFQLQSFSGMAVSDSYNDVPGTWTRDGSPLAAVVGVGMMGILILLIACFNLTNTAIAISSRRLKEIGIRKVMGSMRRHLVIQFIGETMLICFIALIVGMLLADWVLIPAFNQLWPEMKLTADYLGKPDFLVFMIITLLFTGLLAGSYPAFYISKFQPTSILKGKLKFGGTNYFTRTLLTLQFAISLIGIVCSFAFTDNAKYQENFDLGFDKKGVVFTYVDNRSEYETYRNVLVENSDIISIAGSQHHIYSSTYNDPIKHEDKEIEVDILEVGDDYVKTVGLTLKDGRDFVKDSETDRKESVIITEGLARKFGWEKPIGKEIIWMDTVKFFVVGVVQDVYNRGLWEEMDPMMIRYGNKDKVSHLIVSANVENIVKVNKFMEEKWKELFPNKLYFSRMMDEEMVEANTVNANIVKMFVFLGIVALILSATGLFTLVSLNIIKRMKEIGVRKVLGASMANISRVINTEFAIILLIACLAGAFLGSWMSAMLMDSIWDYYQQATVVSLVSSASILLLISVLSVSFKIYNTVRLNPSHVLRDE
jgi:putative ABC transport system permease protein